MMGFFRSHSLEKYIRRIKIGKRFFLIFVCLSFIPMFIVGITTYYKSAHSIEQKVSQYCVGINNGIRAQYDFLLSKIDDYTIELAYNNSFQEKMIELSKTKLTSDQYRIENDILSYLKSKVILNQRAITKVGIRTDISESIEYDSDYTNYLKASTPNFISDKIYEEALAANGKLIWNTIAKEDSKNLFGYKHTNMAFQVSRLIRLTKSKGEKIGIISIMYSPYILSKVYEQLACDGDIYLIDSNQVVLYSNNEDFIFKTFPYQSFINDLQLSRIDNSVQVNKYPKENMILTYSQTRNNGWGIVYTTPYQPLIREAKELGLSIVKLSLILLIIAAIAAALFSKSIATPLRRLITATKNVKQQKYTPVINEIGHDEINELTNEFNDMVVQIDDLINQVYETKIREKDSKLRALQAQINPHFLYNTLDSIRWLARENKDFEISYRIQILSNLFRLILKDDKISTTIGEEIKYTEYYLFFQLCNYKDKLDVHWSVDERVKRYKIIKLLLQPIIENAIMHGMVINQQLKININIQKKDMFLYITVIDNGKGLDETNLSQILNENTGGHIGLNNIQYRLKEFFGEEYGLQIKSNIGEGTNVNIRIPALLEDDHNA